MAIFPGFPNHDDLDGFVANEHIDWTSDQGGTNIHLGNIPDLSSVYLALSGGTLTGTATGPKYVASKTGMTASAPGYELSQTWNNGAVTFEGILVNVTDTSSTPQSLLANLKVDNTSVFQITKDGYVWVGGAKVLGSRESAVTDASTGHSVSGGDSVDLLGLEAALNDLGSAINGILQAMRNHGLIAPS